MADANPAALLGRDRFQALWQRNLVAGARDDSAAIHRQLLDAYREPQRFYHTLEHVEHCLGMFELCKTELERPDAVELAIWFHDAIYVPGASDNEARSADLYRHHAHGAHDYQFVALVARLIMATLHDGNSLDDPDADYMVDIDLSSFGLDWDAFLRDSKNLRRERPAVSDEDFYRNQGDFQKLLLARERFFHSKFFQQRFEQRARANLARFFDHIGESD